MEQAFTGSVVHPSNGDLLQFSIGMDGSISLVDAEEPIIYAQHSHPTPVAVETLQGFKKTFNNIKTSS